MKLIKLFVISVVLSFQSGIAQDAFNLENVRIHQEIIANGLKTNQVALAWEIDQDPTSKGNKFTLMLQEIAGSILSREWNYSGSNEWPLIDWSKVVLLKNLIDDQGKILETTHIVAQSDEELAKICVLEGAIVGLGGEAKIWYENWLLSLAKSSNTNLKRLAFYKSAGYAEDIGESSNTEDIRTINWDSWESAFNQSDNLGKALLLVCMTDLAFRKEEFTKVATLHMGVFDGNNDDLKAIALHSGSRKLGVAIVGKWKDIADNHTNPKLKALAKEALDKE